MMSRPQSLLALIVAAVVTAPTVARGQGDAIQVLPMDPFRRITGSIQDQAALLRASGAREVDLAIARDIHANAINKELDNWKKYVETYWKNKQTRELARLELERLSDLRKYRYQDNRRAQIDKRWARLRDQLDLGGDPTKGESLNFLLNRLSVTLLGFDFSGKRSNLPEEAFEELKISDQMLHSLRLRQANAGGSQIVFRADADAGFELNYWPYLLRGEGFSETRDNLKAARANVIREVNTKGRVSPTSLQSLEDALLAITRLYYLQFKAEEYARKGPDAYAQFLAGEVFLQSLHRELRAIQAKGDIRVFPGHIKFDPKEEDQHAIELLTYMIRNGLEFAPAEPNDSAAYHRMFHMMRALYLVHAPADTGAQPKSSDPKK